MTQWRGISATCLLGVLFLISSISPNLSGSPVRNDTFLEPLLFADGNISYSLTGIHNIKDVYNTRIIGEDFPSPGGKLGFHIENGPLLVARQYLRDKGDGTPITYYWGYPMNPINGRYPEVIDLSGDDIEKSIIHTYTKWVDYDPKPMDHGDIEGEGGLDYIYGDNLIVMDNGTFGCAYININGSSKSFYGPNDDGFSRWVALGDLDRDGKDDILIGAPDADGPDGEVDVGAIYVILGRNGSEIPPASDIRDMVDIILYGTMSKDDDPQGSGQKLGTMFDLGDVNGDGADELVVGNPRMTFGVDVNTMRISAGSVEVFDIDTLIGPGQSRIRVPLRSDLLSIEGDDPEDSLGHRVMVQDMDMDGVDDLLISAPGGDGLDNDRKRCGEAYIVYGSLISLGKLEVSGPGTEGAEVFAEGGKVDLQVSYIHSTGADEVTGCVVRLDPNGEDITFTLDENGAILTNNDYSTVVVFPEESHIDPQGKIGILQISFELDWYVPLEGNVDILIEMTDVTGNTTLRMYPGAMRVIKDILIKGPPQMRVNGRELLERGSRARPGDEVSIDNLKLHYLSNAHRSVSFDTIDISVTRNDIRLPDIPYTSDFVLAEGLADSDRVEYVFLPSLNSRAIPEGLPIRFVPDTGEHSWVTITMDQDRPETPQDLMVLVDGETHSLYDDDPVIDLTWKEDFGRWGDGGGSGVKEYIIVDGDGESVDVRENGGLLGTYFADIHFEAEAFISLNTNYQFDWGQLGPENPEHMGGYQIMPPEFFSVRLHGWFVQPETGPFALRVRGGGEVKLVIDGEAVLDWTSLSYKRTYTETMRFDEGEELDLEIYYRHRNGYSSLLIEHMDPSGSWENLSSENLLYPSDRITVDTDQHPTPLKIMSVDWVGFRSGAVQADLILDEHGPEFDTSDIPPWVGVNRPTLSLSVRDPMIGVFNGSGIDPDSIEYRLWEDGGAPSEWDDDGIVPMDVDPHTGTVRITCTPYLPGDWKGAIQWRCGDITGNMNRSDLMDIGVDKEGPAVELLGPSPADLLYGSDHTLSLRATDPGSGVDASTIIWRHRLDLERWTDWFDTDVEGISDEVRVDIDVSLPIGYVDIQFMVLDNVGNSGMSYPVELKIMEPPVDQKPVPRISQPVNNSKHPEGWLILLDGSGSDDDDMGVFEELRLTWISNLSGYLGSGPILHVHLPVGVHRLMLFADDGSPGHNMSTWIEIEMIEIDDGGGGREDEPEELEDSGTIWALVAGIALLFIIITLLILLVIRRERGQASGHEGKDGVGDIKDGDIGDLFGEKEDGSDEGV